MNRTSGRLSAVTVASLLKARKSGMYPDGAGLYLQIKLGTCSWIFRHSVQGRVRYMGLGSAKVITLAGARTKAAECRRQIAGGISPLDHKRQEQTQRAIAAAKAITFQECAEGYMEGQRPAWRSQKHAQQWANTLKFYAGPVIGDDLPVQDIDSALVVKVPKPIW